MDQPEDRREHSPVPDGMMPGGMMPGGMMPGGMLPGGMMPGGMMPGGVMPGNTREPRPEGRPMGDLPETAPGPAGLPLPTGDLTGLVGRIPKYLQDEVNASTLYRQLARETTDEVVRSYLEGAAGDEEKHFQLLSDLYLRLTGRRARPVAQRVQNGSLWEGLLIATDGELEAYEEYKDDYQRSTDPYLRWLFFELLSDEVEHAVRFNAALHRLSREGQG